MNTGEILLLVAMAAFVAIATWAISNLEEIEQKKGVPTTPEKARAHPWNEHVTKKDTPTRGAQ